MQFLALPFLAASALAAADASIEWPNSNAWIPEFDNLVAFGDSYTDENRLSYYLEHNGTFPPPGLLLPESNATAGGGITWARWVAKRTGAALYNYAVSGAVCDNKIIYRYLDGIGEPYPDVVYETGAFIGDINWINETTQNNTLYPDRRSNNTVYSMWIGTNDLGNDAFITDSSLNSTTITDYVDCIFDRFDEIYEAGGRYFVLMNVAPLELSPLYGMPGEGGLTASHYWPGKGENISEISNKMKEYSRLVNNIFDYRTPYEVLIAKRYPEASIAVFDTHRLITQVYNIPQDFLDPPGNVTGQYYSCDLSGAVCNESETGAGHFLWYDELHPSERTDEVIAYEFKAVVQGDSKFATYW